MFGIVGFYRSISFSFGWDDQNKRCAVSDGECIANDAYYSRHELFDGRAHYDRQQPVLCFHSRVRIRVEVIAEKGCRCGGLYTAFREVAIETLWTKQANALRPPKTLFCFGCSNNWKALVERCQLWQRQHTVNRVFLQRAGKSFVLLASSRCSGSRSGITVGG